MCSSIMNSSFQNKLLSEKIIYFYFSFVVHPFHDWWVFFILAAAPPWATLPFSTNVNTLNFNHHILSFFAGFQWGTRSFWKKFFEVNFKKKETLFFYFNATAHILNFHTTMKAPLKRYLIFIRQFHNFRWAKDLKHVIFSNDWMLLLFYKFHKFDTIHHVLQFFLQNFIMFTCSV